MHWRQYLRIRTRTPAFLWKLVFGILLAGLALGFVAQWLLARSTTAYVHRLALAVSQESTSAAVNTLDEMLADDELPFEEVLDGLADLARRPRESKPGDMQIHLAVKPIDRQAVRDHLANSRLGANARAIALALWQSLQENAVSPGLAQLAVRTPPVRFANQAVGVFLDAQDADYQAAAAYEREGRIAEAKAARKRAVDRYASKHDAEALTRLANDPSYANELSGYARSVIAAEQRDWWAYFWLLPGIEWGRYSIGSAALALFTGGCWFVFCLQSAQVGTARGARWWMCALALLLGVLSVWPTFFFIGVQEIGWGLTESDDLVPGIRYNVLGIGLREEFSKLLLLLPLMPMLVRRGSELGSLMVSACVGLGFAFQENTQYFQASFGSESIVRYLTANFFHMAATGLIGLAVMRGVRHPRTKGAEALLIFVVIVFAHGMYDALGSIPSLVEYSMGSMVIYILLAYQFFHELRGMWVPRHDTVSLAATFLCGVSLVTAVTFIYISSQLGCSSAVRLLVPEVLSTVLMVIMFLREMPGSLVSQ